MILLVENYNYIDALDGPRFVKEYLETTFYHLFIVVGALSDEMEKRIRRKERKNNSVRGAFTTNAKRSQ